MAKGKHTPPPTGFTEQQKKELAAVIKNRIRIRKEVWEHYYASAEWPEEDNDYILHMHLAYIQEWESVDEYIDNMLTHNYAEVMRRGITGYIDLNILD